MPGSVEEFVTPGELARRIRDGIAALGDPAKAGPMRDYMRSDLPYRGVTARPLARLCRSAYDAWVLPDEEAWRAAVLTLWDRAGFREERYAATTLARHRHYREHQQPHTLDLYRHLIRTGAWWDHVDEVATHLVRGLLERHPGPVTPVLHEWAVAEDLWLRRAAIICQVGRGAAIDRELLSATIDANLDGSTRGKGAQSPYGTEFFIRKAIGWALRDQAGTAPDWVRAFVAERETRLSGLSRREALRRLPD